MTNEMMEPSEQVRADRPTARFLTSAIQASGLSQVEIAKRSGYQRPNVISMMKKGQCKVPIARIPALARACGADEWVFLETALKEYHPEVWGTIRHYLLPSLQARGWAEFRASCAEEIDRRSRSEITIRNQAGKEADHNA